VATIDSVAGHVKPKRAYDATLRQELAQLTRQRILDAARRLLVEGIYSQVTMEEIGKQAGVAYQTLYAIFRTKLRLAEAIVAADWPHITAAVKLLDVARGSSDPAIWLATLATMSRRIYEPCADLLRFMRESGDAALLGRYREIERGRHDRLKGLRELLDRSPRLRAQLTAPDAIDVIWSLSGPDHYIQLAFGRGWSPDRYEAWLGDALRALILRPGAPAGRAAVAPSAGEHAAPRRSRR